MNLGFFKADRNQSRNNRIQLTYQQHNLVVAALEPAAVFGQETYERRLSLLLHIEVPILNNVLEWWTSISLWLLNDNVRSNPIRESNIFYLTGIQSFPNLCENQKNFFLYWICYIQRDITTVVHCRWRSTTCGSSLQGSAKS